MKVTVASLAFALLATSSCMDRKTFHDDASTWDGGGSPDSAGKPGADGAGAVDTAAQADGTNAPDAPISIPDAPAGVTDGGPTQTGGATGTGGAGGTNGVDAPVGTGGAGSGGAGGTGGAKGSGGGVVSSGGVPASGGVVSSGGAPGSGGVVGSGGIAASGGAVATGGVVGTGGIKGTGGSTTCQSRARDCTSSLDNDCNGTPDNQDSTCVCPAGTSGPCPGNNNPPCKAGTRTCILSADKTSTAWSTTCVGQVLPAAADTCSRGNDANCNGVPNEGCQCINEDSPLTCPCGTQTCTNGHLGACVTTCSATQTCNSAGQCVCNTGLTPCNGACVNTQSDPNNCGGCGSNTCATNSMGCSAGQCVCTANTPNGQFCTRPGQVRGTCWSGACVLPAYFSGCNTAADCVPGGCTGPGGYCLGTIDVAGEVNCTDSSSGSYVVCTTSQGCSPGPSTGQVQCGPGGLGVTTCDGPSDCTANSDCCTQLLGSYGSLCVARPQSGVIGSGCAALDPSPFGPQSSVVCDPLNPTANCPVGKSCVRNVLAQFLCQ